MGVLALGPFYVGTQPADALDITVTRAGDDAPLSGFTGGVVEIRRPDGTFLPDITASLILPDTVRAAWPTNPFTQTGVWRVRARLTGSGGVKEWTAWIWFLVRP
jgi:hypothetical protein